MTKRMENFLEQLDLIEKEEKSVEAQLVLVKERKRSLQKEYLGIADGDVFSLRSMVCVLNNIQKEDV